MKVNMPCPHCGLTHHPGRCPVSRETSGTLLARLTPHQQEQVLRDGVVCGRAYIYEFPGGTVGVLNPAHLEIYLDSKASSPWQPIDLAPKDGTLVDLWVVERDGRATRWADCIWGDTGWCSDGVGIDFLTARSATHFMLPPEGPK